MMFALRRAALRIAQQPSRQLSTIRPIARPSQFQPQIISSCRSFHQTLRWAAEEEKKPAEEAAASPAEAQDPTETVTTEPSAAEQAEIKEESIATPDVADAAQQQSSSAEGTISDILSEGKSRAESAVSSARDAFSSVSQTVQQATTGRDRRGPGGRERRPETPPSKVLYVGNLFFEVTAPALEAEFSRYGEIVNSRIVTDPRGMSKGFGYVEFTSQTDADAALDALDQQVFQGRRMAVQYHMKRDFGTTGSRDRRAREPGPPSKTLFIGNMSYQMSDRDLNDLFKEIKNVLDVRVAIDRRSGQPRGFAHADFVDIESAEQAKALLERKVVYGRQLNIDFSAGSAQDRSPGHE
ncbi:uncharacterized protein RCC_03069 [Ramularia collo-cygni]|uniref:RRM domain-containing protein n=1 Tax=Ramularia collo-cygni TaxID=112498 RepID=A0A2D3V132_9PEZI|nr:uncharacterized protein RCC_03069 [Ramularia collo-cygni]CZT17236.1 uncharacterized protein RCC_03069 [Ramularia collo-cygni]